jgi:DNA-binding response OmpR family regulator
MHTWQLDARRGFLVAPDGGRKIVSPTERLILNVLAEDGCVRSHRELAVALGLHPENFDKHRIEVIVSRLRRSTYRETGIHLPLTSVRRLGYQLLDVQVV